MTDQRFTILIVPSANKTLCKFRVSHKYLYYGLIVLALLSAVGLGSMIHYVKVYREARSVEQVRRENAELRANLKMSEEMTQKLNRKISALTRLSTRLKSIAGMPPLTARKQPTDSKLGMGGFSTGSTNSDLSALEKRAELLENSLLHLQSYIQTERPFSTPSIYPAEGFVSSYFGSRLNPFTTMPDFHQGIDISNDVGTPVLATAQGTVVLAGYVGSFGLTVEIEHENGIKTIFGHLARIHVKPGQTVSRGHQIGVMGNTGMSTGPHVHYEIRIGDQPVNPRPYLIRRNG